MLSLQSNDDSEYYGYGIWLGKTEENTYIPYFQGSDPGVSFVSCYDRVNNICITAVSNFGCNVWKLRREIYKSWESKINIK